MSRKVNPRIEVKNWVVTKVHLEKVFSLLKRRFGSSTIKVVLEFDEEEEEFDSLVELEKCIENEVIDGNKEIKAIKFRAYKSDSTTFSLEKSVYIEINFYIPQVYCFISGQGNGQVRDWTYGVKKDIDSLFNSFKPGKELIDYIIKSDKSKRISESSIIVFDYNNEITERMNSDRKNQTHITQIHSGKGDNIIGEKKDGNPGIEWHDKWWIKYLIFPLLVAFLIYLFGWNGEHSILKDLLALPEQSRSSGKSELKEVGSLKPLNPLETGKKISELPNNTYFFAYPLAIQYEIDDQSNDFLEATNNPPEGFFEIQKIENRYYLIGFVSDEAYSRRGSLSSEKTLYTVLFPTSWGGAKNPIGIPFEAIYTIQERRIDLDEGTTVSAFDIGFKEMVSDPEIHTNQQ